MSNTQFAFIKRNDVPSKEALQASIDRLGFDLKLHSEFTPFSDSGFSPCVLNGIPDVGFEISYEPASAIVEDAVLLQEIAGDRDFAISMVWGSSMGDCASAMIVSCALAKDFGAVISYEGAEPEPFEDFLQSTKSIIADAMKEAKRRERRQPAVPEVKPARPWWRFWRNSRLRRLSERQSL